MPHTAYTDEELGLTPGWDEHLDPNIRKEIRAARQTSKELEAAQAKIATYERERVLSRAGIPQDKKGDAFAQLYTGDTSDPAVVKAAYEELFGPLNDATGTAGGTGTPDPNDPDPAATQRRIAEANAAGTGAGTAGTVSLEDAIKGAKTTAEVLEIIRHAPPEAGIRLPEDA